MLNNPPGTLPSAVIQTPDTSKYPYIGDDDYKGSKYHRWLLAYDIGTIATNGSNSIQVTPGLANGQSMLLNVDQVPDRFVIVVWAEGASGAAANYGTRVAKVVLGAGGGTGYQLGPGGKLKIPAQGHNFLTITNIATATVTVHGTVVAIGGFDLSDIDLG